MRAEISNKGIKVYDYYGEEEFSLNKLFKPKRTLPSGCILNTTYNIVTELAPNKYTVRANDDIYTVQMPWQYFNFGIGDSDSLASVTLHWSRTRVKSLTSPILLEAPLPNIQSGEVCLGNNFPSHTTSLKEAIESVIATFYQSEFTEDYEWNTPSHYDDGKWWDEDPFEVFQKKMKRWEKDSKNRMCYLDWSDWRNHLISLSDLITDTLDSTAFINSLYGN
jgi:hypothetical protein